MRRLALAALLAGIVLAPAACKRASKHTAARNAELLSVVPMDDPHASAQLIRGFYPPEGTWRWTQGKFSVILRPPPGAAQYGARLELILNIPDVVIRELDSVTLSATIGGNRLAPQKYPDPGNQIYSVEVPASALPGDSVTVEFATDKAIPAGKIEKRELALIVTSVGLVTK